MIGMIVTGHGKFASGISSGLQLISGLQEGYVPVDFLPEDSIENLTDKLNCAIEQLSAYDGIIIFADLVGGSPFNVSIQLKMTRKEKIEVIGGANFPAILETSMVMSEEYNPETLAVNSVESGKGQMIHYEPILSDTEEEYEE